MTTSASLSSAPALSQASLRQFCDFITGHLGIKMSEAKRPMLQSRLQRRIRTLGLPSLDAYREYLFQSPAADEERTHFLDAVTTNKTDFFREPRHFDYLTRVALPTLDPARAGASDARRSWSCRVWCAGCSSGEETYTLAMTLAGHAEQRPGFDFSILGTDISTRVLQHAQDAIYDMDRITPIPDPLRRKHLLRSRDPRHPKVRIAPELRTRVGFRRLNFMDTDYGIRERFDVIFFRNVMIYFDKPTQEAVIHKLCRHLRPGGYLFVGHAESLAGLQVPVRQVDSAVYRIE